MKTKTGIKPVGSIKVTKRGTAHIPEILRRELDYKRIPFIINARTALLFKPDLSADEVVRSVRVLLNDLLLRAGMDAEVEINFKKTTKVESL